MRVRGSVVSVMVTVVALSPAAAQVSGSVFNDRNANGQRDAGEPGMARVVVSNQFDAVVSDSSGSFRLGGPGTGVVFVSVPDGFRATTRFWQRADTPALAFGLSPAPSQEVLTFIHYDFKRRHFSDEEILEKERSLRALMKPWPEQRIIDSIVAAGFGET